MTVEGIKTHKHSKTYSERGRHKTLHTKAMSLWQ